MSRIAVIILNWNGHSDTLECLESLLRNDTSLFDIIVVDNGSKDESVVKIQKWFRDQALTLITVASAEVPQHIGDVAPAPGEALKKNPVQKFTLLVSDLNLGFSAGNNLGIRYALMHPYSSILILNNDTTLEPDTIQKLADAMDSNPLWGACVPKIKYYDHPEIIWNAGGFIRPLGGRRYLHPDTEDKASYTGVQQITFATGCALTIRSQIIRKYGGLCEDFFFGEEDYEFSKRFAENNIPMYTVLDAIVYHKVGISRAKLLDQNAMAYAFTHHLNRLIHMKRYMTSWQWKFWRFGSLFYLFFLLVVKKRVPLNRKLVRYFKQLILLSDRHTGVDKELFLQSKEILK